MNPTPHTPIDRTRQALALGLAALLTATSASGQAPDANALRRLQEENAALRKRLAEMQGAQAQPATTTTTTTTTRSAQPTGPAAPATGTISEPSEPGVVSLSPFEVTTEKDNGYLKTNAATATRINMEIQNIPLNVAVISREFLDDTNAKSVTDLLRYSAASSGDTRFVMRVPANQETPQGTFTMRGFQVSTIMRDGILRYTANNLDNIDRVEVVKGPASVFFGQGYPGGVINYISKQASLSRIPTSFTFKYDDNAGTKVQFDNNTVLSKKAAFRIVGGWEDTTGERRYEFRKNFNITPSVVFIPFDSGKVKISADFEYLKERYNYNDWEWIYSDFAGWKAAATTGQYGTSTATLSNTIVANAGNGLTANVLQNTTTPTVLYATYINNKRTSTGDLTIPAYTSISRGAYYTNAAGQFVQDEAFNWTSRGSWSDNQVRTLTARMEVTPFEWLSGQYVLTRDQSNFNNSGNSAVISPYADGVHYNVGLSAGGSGYWRTQDTHTFDVVLSGDKWGTKNKLLIGAQISNWRQQYLGKAAASDVNLAFLPGARNSISNPDYLPAVAGEANLLTEYRRKYEFGGVPVNQVIRDRAGNIKPVRQIYSNWDPGAEINPDITVYWQDDRNALDGYRPNLEGQYINYQGRFLNDRLTVLGGYREEKRWERWQDQSNNYPWYVYVPDMYQDPVKYPESVWGHSINYQKTIPVDQKGNSWMAGASFAVNKNVSVYGSISSIFKLNIGNIGGLFPGDELKIAQGIMDEYASRGQPGGFVYRGQSITSVAQFQKIIDGLGYYNLIPNEIGKNYEVGVKYTSPNNKLVGTFSIFSANRTNRKEDDSVASSNTNEPLNAGTDPIWIAGINRAIVNGATNPGVSATSTGRVFRVRAFGNKVEIHGTEVEAIWTPIRNFQAIANASWLPKAETVADSRPIYAKPGSTGYQALNPTQKRDADILWGARVENVPEYRFNFFGKYTFTDTAVRGLSLGGGLRYSSETVVSRSVDWNPLAGGFQAGNYVVVDITAGYPWEVFGYQFNTSFGVYNATDKLYAEGSFVAQPGRNWLLTNTLRF